jgi:copper chaperone CopZ
MDFSSNQRSAGVVLRAFALVMVLMGAQGCSSECAYEVTEEFEPGSTETSTAKLEISGMMCAHACGGKIKKELLEMPGVANAAIEFESGRELNAAQVEFDPKLVSPDDLAAKVAAIADGKLYSVASVQITHFAKEAARP